MKKILFYTIFIFIFHISLECFSKENNKHHTVNIGSSCPYLLYNDNSVIYVKRDSSVFRKRFVSIYRCEKGISQPSMYKLNVNLALRLDGNNSQQGTKQLCCIFEKKIGHKKLEKAFPIIFISNIYEKDFSISSQLRCKWVGFGVNVNDEYFYGNTKSRKSQSSLGNLFAQTYTKTIRRVASFPIPKYPNVSADAIKPYLFNINDNYYNVFGDTKISIHIPVKEYLGALSNLYLAGNILFAANKNLPPTLQSCGVDGNNTIWISDMEGNIAFFDTHKNIYMPYIARCANAKKLRIPRRNLVSSVFAYDKNKDQFIEYTISSVKLSEADKLKKLADIPVAYGIISRESRILPADTFQVLLCDAGKLVYVTNTFASIKFKDKSRNIKVPIKLGDNELLVEGVFDEKNNKIHLLVRQKAKDEKNVFEVRKTWNKMRLLTVDLAIDNIGHNVIKD